MGVSDYFKKALAKEFATAYRRLFEGGYNPGSLDQVSTDLETIRLNDFNESPIRLVHISDLHVGNHSPQKLIDLKRTLKDLKPHFLIISGDIVHYPEAPHFQNAKGILKDLASNSREVLVIPGNHDRHGMLDLTNWATEIESGASPLFQCRKYELSDQRFLFFFLLNSTIAKTNGLVDQTIHDLVQVRGWIDDAQVAWLQKMQNTIQAHHKTEYARGLKVAVLHHHPLPVGDDGYLTEAFMSLGNSNRVLSILADMKIDLVLHGHKHIPAIRTLDMADRGHRLVILSAGTATSHIESEEKTETVSSQCGFFVVDVDPKSVSVEERRYINKIPLPEKFAHYRRFRFRREVRKFSKLEIEMTWTIKFPKADWHVHETHRVLGHPENAETDYEFDWGVRFRLSLTNWASRRFEL